jgi:cytochrome c-type biogenesis protein
MMTDRVPTIGEALLSGLLSFGSPCLLALLPVALVYVTGVSLERRNAGGGDGWRLKGSLLLHLSVFLAGFIAVLVGMAAGHTALGRLFLVGQRGMTVLGGILAAVMGVFMTGLVPRAAQGDVRLRFRHRFFGYAVSAAVGATYGLVWSPCVGPVLGSIILLAGSPDTSDMGIPLLVLHGAGFGAPFLLAGLLFDAALQRVKDPRAALVLEKAAGALLAAAGFLIATGKFLALTDWMFQAFDFWVQVLIRRGL